MLTMNKKVVAQALTYSMEAIDLYLAMLKKYEPMNKADVVDAEFLKDFVQVQRDLLIKNE
jgi:hypothetical protein